MDVEQKIRDCCTIEARIRQYDPDPHHVGYFFGEFARAVNDAMDGIFGAADRHFGLYQGRACSQEAFAGIAAIKNDKAACEFAAWFMEMDRAAHGGSLPRFIRDMCAAKRAGAGMPRIRVMLRAKERYEGDVPYELTRLVPGMPDFGAELGAEVARQCPAFLDIINRKRQGRGEPKVRQGQVVAAAFARAGGVDYEVSHAVSVYIPVIRRIASDSNEKLAELSARP